MKEDRTAAISSALILAVGEGEKREMVVVVRKRSE
jgi:hypothetical protein